MKTKLVIPIIAGVIALVIGGIVVFLDSGISSYEGIRILRFSDYEFQKFRDEHADYINIVKITDDDLKKVPKIRDLINRSLQKEFTLSQDNGIETEKSIEVFASLAVYEIETYQKWSEDLGLGKGRAMIAGSVLEYKDQYYLLSFTIA